MTRNLRAGVSVCFVIELIQVKCRPLFLIGTLLMVALISAFPVDAQTYALEGVPTPSNNIVALAQDHQGFLWMAGTGLHRYDGYTFKTYRHDPADSTSLSSNDISNVLVGNDGTLWVGVEGPDGGLHRFNPATTSFTRYQHDPSNPEGLSSNSVFSLYEDRAGVLWLGTHDGHLIRYNRSAETFSSFLPPGAGIVEEILEDHLGTLWVGTTGGLFTFDRQQETFSNVNFAEETSGEVIPASVSALHEDRDGILWVGSTANTLFQYDLTSKEAVRHTDVQEERDAQIEDIHEDRHGNLWVVAWGSGLKRFDRETHTFTAELTTSGTNNVIIASEAYRIYEDGFGTVWVSMLEVQPQDRKIGGLFKIVPSPGPFTFYLHDPDNPESLAENTGVFDFHNTGEGKLWMATRRGGVNVFDPETGRFAHPGMQGITSRRLRTNTTSSLLKGRDGAWWVGGFSPGLQRYDPDTGSFTDTDFHLDNVNGAIASGVTALFEDRSGILWIGTWRSGLIRFNPTTGDLTRYRPDPENAGSLNGDIVYAIHEDRLGNLWIGAMPLAVDARTGALQRFDRETETFEQFTEFGASSVFEDSAGNLWVRSLTTGLYKWDVASDTYVHYSQENGLPSNQIGCVVEDGRNNLWITSSASLARLDPVNGAVHHVPFSAFQYDFAFSNAAGSCIHGEDGNLYFGGVSSVLSFNPENFEMNTQAPEVVLSGLEVGGEFVSFGDGTPLDQPIERAESMVLTHAQSDFSIQYTGLHYEDPARIIYRYKLEPFNEDWVEAGMERWARFFKVPPADYTLRVQAASPNGIWNEEGATVAVTILAPWWRTNWAFLLYGILLVSSFIAANRIQRRRLIRIEREQARIKLAQQEAAAAAERAEMAEHLEEVKSRFFVNLSHEFRTPLTLLLGPLRDILDDAYGILENRLRHPLEIMQRNGNRLLTLINEFLDFEKLEAGGLHLQARQHDIVAFTRALTFSFISRAEREQKALQFNTEENEALVYFDPAKLEKCLYNLLSNAFKFTTAGGSITVSVRTDANTVQIQVRDTGRGIPETELAHIFNRFYQVDDASTRGYEGTGIGLALTKELVELHGGTISAESLLGEGSTFMLTLPLGRAHLRKQDLVAMGDVGEILSEGAERYDRTFAKDRAPVAAADTKHAATILIVEDNADLREYLKMQLTGYHIAEAENGKAGLEKAMEILPDLVISDVMMPVMDGLALCDALRKNKKTQDVPVILLTAKATEDHKIEGLQSGADDYLYKPFSARELLARTENLIDLRSRLQSQYRSEMVLKPADVAVTSEQAAFVEKVRSIVEEQMGDSWFGVERLAEEVGLSRRQLQRRINAIMQTTASTFIRDMRLERAAQLLQKRTGNVSEVAYAVGYNDVGHFSKLFKKKYNSSPSDYMSNMGD